MSDPKPRQKSKAMTLLLGAATLGLLGTTLTGQLGPSWWVADLFSHFAVYYAIASAALLLLAVLLKRYKSAVVLVLILGVNVWLIYPAFNPLNKVQHVQGPSLRLVQMNILHKNRDSVDVLAFLEKCDADIVFVQEVDPWWAGIVSESGLPYHFAALHPAESSFGIGMLVRNTLDSDRLNLEAVRVIDLAESYDGAERPAIEATLLFAGRRVQILSIHPPPPTTAEYSRMRDDILQQARDWSDTQTDPHIIIGDFNTTPWSHTFAILTKGSQLRNSLNGRGNQGSWPAHIPVPLRLPIDHCLFSPEWCCTERLIGGDIGSDHRPLIVTLSLIK